MIEIYISADPCPVKQEIYRVAERHAAKGATLSSLPGSTRQSMR
jgi:uncharacterized protein YaiI (UPF0178 family)